MEVITLQAKIQAIFDGKSLNYNFFKKRVIAQLFKMIPGDCEFPEEVYNLLCKPKSIRAITTMLKERCKEANQSFVKKYKNSNPSKIESECLKPTDFQWFVSLKQLSYAYMNRDNAYKVVKQFINEQTGNTIDDNDLYQTFLLKAIVKAVDEITFNDVSNANIGVEFIFYRELDALLPSNTKNYFVNETNNSQEAKEQNLDILKTNFRKYYGDML